MGAGLACYGQHGIVIAALAVMAGQTNVYSMIQQLVGGQNAAETEENSE